MEQKNVGSINDAGILGSLFRKGFSYPQCISEIHANSIDANAKNISYKVEKDKIKVIDDGAGMNYDGIEKMFDIHRGNHTNDKSLGVSGLGAKAATAILSDKTEVKIYTKKEDEPYICAEIPWNEMYKENKYTDMIKVRGMDENEIDEFIQERTNMVNKNGTTIVFKYKSKLSEEIEKQFIPSDNEEFNPESKLSIIYGRFNDIKVTYGHYEKKNEIDLSLYAYLSDDDNEYYKGKSVEEISIYKDKNGEARYIWHSKDKKDYEIKKFGGKGYRKDIDEVVESFDNFKHIGNFKLISGIRRDIEYFDEDKPELPNEAGKTILSYDKQFMPIENNNYSSKVQLVRNGQVIAPFELPDNKISSARGNAESRHNISMIHSSLEYNPISMIDNEQDILAGIQENKNQYKNNMDLPLLRLIKAIRQKKAKEIWEYFKEVVEKYKTSKDIKTEEEEEDAQTEEKVIKTEEEEDAQTEEKVIKAEEEEDMQDSQPEEDIQDSQPEEEVTNITNDIKTNNVKTLIPEHYREQSKSQQDVIIEARKFIKEFSDERLKVLLNKASTTTTPGLVELTKSFKNITDFLLSL
jgi:hypothetical protein